MFPEVRGAVAGVHSTVKFNLQLIDLSLAAKPSMSSLATDAWIWLACIVSQLIACADSGIAWKAIGHKWRYDTSALLQ
jgi:hypothetical protein